MIKKRAKIGISGTLWDDIPKILGISKIIA
jgi:hypothetical protein